jgi:molybdopterin-guanine dinucleotide biosynthesis adapter protein
MLSNAHVPIIGFAAFSGTGKTTLLRRLLPLLRDRGLRIALVKHAHHRFEVDHPGKDSYELRKAGAQRVLVTSRDRWALMVERDRPREPRLDEALLELDQGGLDLIVVEGFKRERFPKVELHRPSLGHPLLFPDDDCVIAVASDGPLPRATDLPLLDLNRPEAIAGFLWSHLALEGPDVATGA